MPNNCEQYLKATSYSLHLEHHQDLSKLLVFHHQ